MRVIGLTGALGAGKSVVAAMLAELGAEIIDADAEGHRSYGRGTPGWRSLLELFGDRVLGEDGAVDRARLGAIVFADPVALASLNAAIHPLIRQRIVARLAELEERGAEVAAVDAALLYQAGWDDLTDEVWVVAAPLPAMMDRLSAQRGISPREARRRLESQGPPGALTRRADVVIDNSGSLEQLRATVEALWSERILSKGSGSHGRKD